MKKGLKTLMLFAGISGCLIGTKLSFSHSAHAYLFNRKVTCYSTVRDGGSWLIYLCGCCEQTDNMQAFMDRGSCSAYN